MTSYLGHLRYVVLHRVHKDGKAHFGSGYGPMFEVACLLVRDKLLRYSDFGPGWFEMTDAGRSELTYHEIT